MEEFNINKEYKVGANLTFNGIMLTVVNDFNCNKCFFKNECKEQRNFFPICCEGQRDDRNDIVFVESKNKSNE